MSKLPGDNPFMDPSVQQAQGGSTDVSNLPTNTAAPSQAAPQAERFPGEIVVHDSGSGDSSSAAPAWKEKKDKGLPLTESELREWEADLRKREDGGLARSDGREPNWPPCWPKVRIAIDEDIPSEEGKSFVKYMLWCWYANILALAWNFICMCAYVADKDDNVAWVFLALAFFVIGVPAAYYLWFRLGYRAAETSSNFLMFLWLVLFGLCALFWAACAVGVPDAAMAGMISMIMLYDDDHNASGMMCLLGFIMYVLVLVAMVWTWFKGKAIYTGTGGTEATKETYDQSKKVAKAANAAV